jgi:hypothetical protein
MSDPSALSGALPPASRPKGRSSVRLACNLRGLCRWSEGGGEQSGSVRVRNVSQGGLSLSFDGPAPLASFVDVDLRSADGSFTCSLRARLLYKVDQPGGGAIVGASFPDRLDPMTLRALLS